MPVILPQGKAVFKYLVASFATDDAQTVHNLVSLTTADFDFGYYFGKYLKLKDTDRRCDGLIEMAKKGGPLVHIHLLAPWTLLKDADFFRAFFQAIGTEYYGILDGTANELLKDLSLEQMKILIKIFQQHPTNFLFDDWEEEAMDTIVDDSCPFAFGILANSPSSLLVVPEMIYWLEEEALATQDTASEEFGHKFFLRVVHLFVVTLDVGVGEKEDELGLFLFWENLFASQKEQAEDKLLTSMAFIILTIFERQGMSMTSPIQTDEADDVEQVASMGTWNSHMEDIWLYLISQIKFPHDTSLRREYSNTAFKLVIAMLRHTRPGWVCSKVHELLECTRFDDIVGSILIRLWDSLSKRNRMHEFETDTNLIKQGWLDNRLLPVRSRSVQNKLKSYRSSLLHWAPTKNPVLLYPVGMKYWGRAEFSVNTLWNLFPKFPKVPTNQYTFFKYFPNDPTRSKGCFSRTIDLMFQNVRMLLPSLFVLGGLTFKMDFSIDVLLFILKSIPYFIAHRETLPISKLLEPSDWSTERRLLSKKLIGRLEGQNAKVAKKLAKLIIKHMGPLVDLFGITNLFRIVETGDCNAL